MPSIKDGINPLGKGVRDVWWSGIATSGDVLTGFILLLLVGNALAIDGLGGYTLCVTIYSLATALFAAGINVAVVIYGARCHGDRQAFSSLGTTALALALTSGAASGIVLWATAPLAATLLSAPTLEVTLPIISMAVALGVLNRVALGLLNSRRQMRTYAVVLVARNGTLIACTMAVLRGGLGLRGAALAFAVAEGAILCPLALSLRRSMSLRFVGAPVWARRLISLGARALLATIVNDLGTCMDRLMVAYFMSEGALGVYSIAALLARGPVLLLSSVQRIASPVISEHHGAGRTHRIGELTRFLANFGVLFMGVSAAVLALFFPTIVALLYPGKPELLNGAFACHLLLLGSLFRSAIAPYGAMFTAMKRPGLGTAAAASFVIANLVLSILLIPRLGIEGAAISVSGASAVMLACFGGIAWWRLRVRVWSPCLFLLLAAGSCAAASGFFASGLAARLAIMAFVLIGCALLGLLLWRNRPRQSPPEA